MKVEMKDSGIKWIGEIPNDWFIYNIGSCTTEVNTPNGNSGEINALQFKMGEIIRKSDGNSKYNPETLEAYNLVDEGVVMINGLNLSFDLISQRVGIVKERGVITSTYIAIKPNDNIYSDFFKYLMKAYDNCKAFHAMGRGLRQTLSYGELKKHPIIVPPFQLQQQIANFLDDKCADIDQLIALQQQMIDELKAYKQSVITEAVCKGLDKSVPMKDSGIEWIGEVPEGWKITKLKNVSKLKTGGTPNGYDNQSDFTTRKPWFTPSDFNENYKLIQSNRFLNLEVIENEKIILFPKHTVLMVCIGTVGKVGILTEEGYCNQQVTAIIPNGRMLPEYILYTLIAENKIIRDLANYTILPIINNSFLKEIILVCPTFEEQKNIVAFIEHKSSQIDTLISIKQQKINELKEYKKSMIYEYITGKKQVPND